MDKDKIMKWLFVNSDRIQMSAELRQELANLLTEVDEPMPTKTTNIEEMEEPKKRKRGSGFKYSKKIRVADKCGEIKTYKSVGAAADALGVSGALVSMKSRTPSFGFINSGKLKGKIIEQV